jgi:hypothetical protein
MDQFIFFSMVLTLEIVCIYICTYRRFQRSTVFVAHHLIIFADYPSGSWSRRRLRSGLLKASAVVSKASSFNPKDDLSLFTSLRRNHLLRLRNQTQLPVQDFQPWIQHCLPKDFKES